MDHAEITNEIRIAQFAAKSVIKEKQTMKKSEIYHLAQIAVVTANCITPENKLIILDELLAAEHLAQFVEKREEEEEEC